MGTTHPTGTPPQSCRPTPADTPPQSCRHTPASYQYAGPLTAATSAPDSLTFLALELTLEKLLLSRQGRPFSSSLCVHSREHSITQQTKGGPNYTAILNLKAYRNCRHLASSFACETRNRKMDTSPPEVITGRASSAVCMC